MNITPKSVRGGNPVSGGEFRLHFAHAGHDLIEVVARPVARRILAPGGAPEAEPNPDEHPNNGQKNQSASRKLHVVDVLMTPHETLMSDRRRYRLRPMTNLIVHPSVVQALADGRAVVALESTISSTLGLPVPFNQEVLTRCIKAIEAGGGVAAVTAVIDGVARVGVDEADLGRVLIATRKCAERDLSVAIAERWDVGVTTVSATVALAAAAGVRVFATGGIGGVHRDDHLTGDVSADLGAIARHPVIVVTAGAKAFLDLSKTAEMLDSLSVPVLGFQTDEFPAFYSRTSGIAVHRRIDDLALAARVLEARLSLGLRGGVIVANPIPSDAEIPASEIEPVLRAALAEAVSQRVTGAALTPFVLGRIALVTGGRSIPANLALAENNAVVATKIANALLS